MSDVLKIISRTDAKIDAVLDTLVRRASHICGPIKRYYTNCGMVCTM
jgi:hypothetical protein